MSSSFASNPLPVSYSASRPTSRRLYTIPDRLSRRCEKSYSNMRATTNACADILCGGMYVWLVEKCYSPEKEHYISIRVAARSWQLM